MPADEFDFLMRTPTELDIKSAAAMFNVDHQRVADTTELAQALEADGTRIIEIPLQTG
jgi:2-succinyl-5-enolpyruvyl-6-hydroxy-3-cyclohexene-1-carboxylate synthase